MTRPLLQREGYTIDLDMLFLFIDTQVIEGKNASKD
jgi:hypothetical protein